jgi:hypothetical protein
MLPRGAFVKAAAMVMMARKATLQAAVRRGESQ